MNLPSQWNAARTYHEENKRALKWCSTCVVEPDEIGRYILVCAQDRNLAWSGNQWVPRDRSQAQVSNWRTEAGAILGAGDARLIVSLLRS